MTSVDLIVLAVMAISGLLAFFRGLVREVLSIAAWIGAGVVALGGLPFARPLVKGWVPAPEWIDPAGYILLFAVALIVFSLIAKLIGGMVSASAIGGVDRSLGLLFGFGRGFVLAVIAYIVGQMAVPVDKWPAEVLAARGLPLISSGAALLTALIPADYRPVLQPPPAPRQATLNPILNAAPAGRAIDPPVRR